VSKLKSAGCHRPKTEVEVIPLGHMGTHQMVDQETRKILQFKVIVRNRSSGWLQAREAIRIVGFTNFAKFCEDRKGKWNEEHPELGRIITRAFVDPDLDGYEMRMFKGVVIENDRADPERQFRILYEDGDGEWLAYDSLSKLWKNTKQQ